MRPGYRGKERGFTLIELLTVVVIIAVLVGLAIPLSSQVMRDQRVDRAALHIAEMYRQARTRSLGRGTAVLVRWTSGAGAAGKGELDILEATLNPTGLIPNSAGCIGTSWTIGNADNQTITSFQPGAGPYEYAAFQMTYPDVNTNIATLDVCFTPHGRSWFRTDPAAAFTPLTNVPIMRVSNTNTGRPRNVLLPPTGDARVEL